MTGRRRTVRAPGGPGYPQADTVPGGAEPLTTPQVADCYVFPQGTDGTGETLAMLEFDGG